MKNIFFVIISIFLITNLAEARRIHSKTIAEFVQEYPQTKWIKCTQNYAFNYTPYPLYQDQDPQSRFSSSGYYDDMSVIEVCNGVVEIGLVGYILVNDIYIQETQIKFFDPVGNREYFDADELGYVPKLPGRLAVLSHCAPYVYGHWMFDILGQLALLELHNIEYDYLWIPYYEDFMQQTLSLWGINPDKIIPLYLQKSIAADTIIIPTCVGKHDNGVYYYSDFLLKYVREKMLRGIQKRDSGKKYSDKIFISRRHAKRFMPNEDEIFALFEPFGFHRYELGALPVEQQVALFHNAKIIVSFVGSGSTNIMFCRPETLYIEIVQNFVDATFFFVSDIFKLKYNCINNSTYSDFLAHNPFCAEQAFPLSIIDEYIKANMKELRD